MKKFFMDHTSCLRTGGMRKIVFNYLLKNGYNFTEKMSEADVILIDTCGFHKNTENCSLELIKKAIDNKKRSSKVIAMGCLTKINPKKIKELGKVFLVPPYSEEKLDKIIQSKVRFSEIINCKSLSNPYEEMSKLETPSYLTKKFLKEFSFSRNFFKRMLTYLINRTKNLDKKQSFHLTISTGCLGKCSYCVIKSVWGKMKSRPQKEIINEMKSGLREGKKLLFIDTQDMGAYGLDSGTNIILLLKEMFKQKGDYKLMLHDFNPQWFIKYYSQLEPILIKNKDKIGFLAIPVQSGSNKVLKLMNRPYKIEDIKKRIIQIKKKIPDLVIDTTLMVGFPGETKGDFEETKQFVRDLKDLKSICFFTIEYSDRPGAPSSKMKGRINGKTVQKRLEEIRREIKINKHHLGDGVNYLKINS